MKLQIWSFEFQIWSLSFKFEILSSETSNIEFHSLKFISEKQKKIIFKVIEYILEMLLLALKKYSVTIIIANIRDSRIYVYKPASPRWTSWIAVTRVRPCLYHVDITWAKCLYKRPI